jgi:hypothetical protein
VTYFRHLPRGTEEGDESYQVVKESFPSYKDFKKRSTIMICNTDCYLLVDSSLITLNHLSNKIIL